MIVALIIYTIGVAIFMLFSAMAFYTINEYGYTGDASRPMKIVYIVVSLILIIFTYIFLILGGS